jgi:hypothetical protein
MSQTTTIYVVVNVSYDYYRFQENVGAALDIETARNIAKAFRDKPKQIGKSLHYFNRNLEIVEDHDESWGQFRDRERNHIFIETHTQHFPTHAVAS